MGIWNNDAGSRIMPYLEVSIDVTHALPAEAAAVSRVDIAAWIFLPAPDRLPEVPSTVVLVNGGTYDKRHHRFEVPRAHRLQHRRGACAAGPFCDPARSPRG